MFDAHFAFIWRTARRLGLSPEDADDAAQRVFVIAQRRMNQVDPARERAFLFSTTQRVVAEIRRSSRRRREEPLGDIETERAVLPQPDEAVEQKRARERLDSILSELSDELRTVFILYELEQMTTPEIALLLGVPLGTAASRLRRARAAFLSKVET